MGLELVILRGGPCDKQEEWIAPTWTERHFHVLFDPENLKPGKAIHYAHYRESYTYANGSHPDMRVWDYQGSYFYYEIHELVLDEQLKEIAGLK